MTPLVRRPALRVRLICCAPACGLLALGLAAAFSSVFGIVLAARIAAARGPVAPVPADAPLDSG